MVLSDTFVDQEIGIPHYSVGGPWPGGHQELITYSRHVATVTADGRLDFHSGIVPGGGPRGRRRPERRPDLLLGEIFADGFETGSTARWAAVPWKTRS